MTARIYRQVYPNAHFFRRCGRSLTWVAKRCLVAGQAESSGPVGDRYVRVDIALSMAS